MRDEPQQCEADEGEQRDAEDVMTEASKRHGRHTGGADRSGRRLIGNPCATAGDGFGAGGRSAGDWYETAGMRRWFWPFLAGYMTGRIAGELRAWLLASDDEYAR
jgi:hypothetical protein